jgi:hypothetical protein
MLFGSGSRSVDGATQIQIAYEAMADRGTVHQLV